MNINNTLYIRIQRIGITLTEIMVAALISVIVILAIYSFFSHTTHTALLAKAKGDAKQIAENILRQLERDISTSRVNVKISSSGNNLNTTIEPTFKINNNNFEMIIPESNSWMKVIYQYNYPYLRRIGSYTNKILSENVKELNLSYTSDEQVHVDLKIELNPIGLKQPVVHHQSMLITIQEAVKYKIDPKWRSNNEDILSSY